MLYPTFYVTNSFKFDRTFLSFFGFSSKFKIKSDLDTAYSGFYTIYPSFFISFNYALDIVSFFQSFLDFHLYSINVSSSSSFSPAFVSCYSQSDLGSRVFYPFCLNRFFIILFCLFSKRLIELNQLSFYGLFTFFIYYFVCIYI